MKEPSPDQRKTILSRRAIPFKLLARSFAKDKNYTILYERMAIKVALIKV